MVLQAKQLAEIRNISLSALIDVGVRKIVERQLPQKTNAPDVLKKMLKPKANTEAYSKTL